MSKFKKEKTVFSEDLQKTLYSMNIGEQYIYQPDDIFTDSFEEKYHVYIRVPGGWVYSLPKGGSVFIPYALK